MAALFSDDESRRTSRKNRATRHVGRDRGRLCAKSLRQHARYWLDMAAEMRILENDPQYRCIHDRPGVVSQGERAIAPRA